MQRNCTIKQEVQSPAAGIEQHPIPVEAGK